MHDEDWDIVNLPGTETPEPRPPKVPTPCESCPRKSPEREAETTLTEQNWKAYEWYLQVRATNGACLVGRQKTDPLALRILAIIDGIVRGYEQAIQINALGTLAVGLSRAR